MCSWDWLRENIHGTVGEIKGKCRSCSKDLLEREHIVLEQAGCSVAVL